MFRPLAALLLPAAFAPALHGHSSPNTPLPFYVRGVEFRTKAALRVSERERMTQQLRREVNDSTLRTTDPDHLRDAATEYARRLLQDRGFWKIKIITRLVDLPSTPTAQPVDIVFDINEGTRFYISSITWKGMKEFTQEDLQRAMPLQTGDVARSFRIAKGLDAVRRLYNSRGYVNFTSVPDTKFDDDAHTIAVTIDIDEGKQFRFGDLTLPGLNEHSRQNVLQRWDGVRGSVYSREKEETFFRSVMKPPDRWTRQHPDFTYSSLLHRSLDERAGTVNLSIYFVLQSDKIR